MPDGYTITCYDKGGNEIHSPLEKCTVNDVKKSIGSHFTKGCEEIIIRRVTPTRFYALYNWRGAEVYRARETSKVMAKLEYLLLSTKDDEYLDYSVKVVYE